MPDARRLAALGADHHDIGYMQRHCLLDNARLRMPRPALMCFLAILTPSTITLFSTGHRLDTIPRLPRSLPVSTRTVSPFLHIQLGQVQGILLFLLIAIFPFPLPFGLYRWLKKLP